jgi:hypothetical protein
MKIICTRQFQQNSEADLLPSTLQHIIREMDGVKNARSVFMEKERIAYDFQKLTSAIPHSQEF